MKTTLVITLACLLLISCQKEINFDTPQAGNQACKACSYYPVCDGSVYNYVDSMFTVATEITENIDIIKDTTIDGKVYQKITSGGLSNYHNCTDGVTSAMIFNVPTSVGIVPKVLVRPVRANLGVGATWTDTLANGLGQRVDYDYKIIGKGQTRTVLGVTYNDVMQINVVVTLYEPGFPPVVAVISDYYYANNIGLIEVISYADGLSGPQTVIYHRLLKSYSIP